MNITFYSVNNNNDKVVFTTNGYFENDILVFEDKSCPNTVFKIVKDKETLILSREGDTKMYVELELKRKTDGSYKSDGLEFDFNVITHKLDIKDNRYEIDYSMFIENDMVNHNKIIILLH